MLTIRGRLGLSLGSLLAAALMGCGGGGHSSSSDSNTASLRMSMAWPAPSRMVPNAANSVVTVVKVKGKEIARATFVRPGASRGNIDGGSTTVLLQRLPAGTATVTFTAYPSGDGTGTPQASGATTEILRKGQVTEDTATMASTVDTLAISPAAVEVAVGATQPLEIEARDDANRVVLLETQYRESLTWASASDAKAIVDEGAVTGVAVGTTEASVSMVVNDEGNRKTATAPVTVVAAPRVLVSISLTSSSPAGGEFNATGFYDDHTMSNVTSSVAWSATAPGTITSGGIFTMGAPGYGTSTVTASLNGVSQTSTITVAAPRTLVSIAMNIAGDANAPYDFSDSGIPYEQIDVEGTYSDGTTGDVSSEATWSSDDTSIVEMNGQSMVRKGLGTTVVRVVVGSLNQAVHVRTNVPRTLQSVQIRPGGTVFGLWNQNYPLAAYAMYSDGTEENVTTTATWSSSSPMVSVTSTGVAKSAVFGGTATITATVSGVSGTVVYFVGA